MEVDIISVEGLYSARCNCAPSVSCNLRCSPSPSTLVIVSSAERGYEALLLRHLPEASDPTGGNVHEFQSNGTDWLVDNLMAEDKRVGVAEFDIQFVANGPNGSTYPFEV